MLSQSSPPRDVKGLSEKDVSMRLRRDGLNEHPSSKRKGVFRIVLDVFREPMFILLVLCGSIYLILGDLMEALMLLGFVFVIMGITIFQEDKAERAIDGLRDLSSPRALVIRDGVQKRISGKEVVLDDVIILKEGDRVPADSILVWGINVTADESLLTGESVPVGKLPSGNADIALGRPGGDGLPFLYSGSLIVQGQGLARVAAIGASTQMGRIGKVLTNIKEEETLLQKETGKLVDNIFMIAIVLCILVVLAYGFTRGNWLEAVLSGITLAMAMLPEEFPVVLTIFLALGAWRISRKNVLTRKVAAVETLGAATVLCVDKTGTLTQNRMSIKKLFNGQEFLDVGGDKTRSLPENFHELVEYGILASKKDPFDPMEKALGELGYNALGDTEHIHADWPLIGEYPLSKEMMALSQVWEKKDKKGYVVSAKGAPEAIADLCHFSAGQRDELIKHINVMALVGLRVIGVAHAIFGKENLPKSQHDFNFEFLGLIGLADPIRENVADAVKECYKAGIRVVMITGDYPQTAQNIARQIGLKDPDNIITGPDIDKMKGDEFRDNLCRVNVFSRVLPEQKLSIVDALKSCGEVVAMTGDGVNDAPALKSAHIGVAMGQRGTDVARESSDIVLLDDDFSSIVAAVRLGRRIFDNLKKAMAYIISVHIPIAGASLIPIIMGWPLILFPVHIVFLELIIDPACSFCFESEPEERNVMTRPPRSPKERLFGRKMIVLSALQGLFSLIAVVAVFKAALYLKQTAESARTMAFVTLIVSNLCLILTNRSWSRNMISLLKVNNKALAWVILATAMFMSFVLYLPFSQKLFHFGTLHPESIVICLGAGICTIIWFEFLKYIFIKMNMELMK